MEEWKDIPDYEGLYQASSLGNIKRENKILKPHIGGKPHSNRHYYTVCLCKNNIKKTLPVHRLVASAFYGKSKLTVNHIDGNTFNNNIHNLEYCSLRENIQKGYANGLFRSIQKPIKVVFKKSGEIKVFNGLNEATRYIGKSHNYFTRKIKKNIFENELYKWQLL